MLQLWSALVFAHCLGDFQESLSGTLHDSPFYWLPVRTVCVANE